MVASELNMSSTTVIRIVNEDLAMKKACAKVLSNVLSDDKTLCATSPQVPERIPTLFHSPNANPADFLMFHWIKATLKEPVERGPRRSLTGQVLA